MSSNNPPPVVIKGKLKLKASLGTKKAVHEVSNGKIVASGELSPSELRKRKLEEVDQSRVVELSREVHLTESQKKFKQKSIEREKSDAKKLSTTSYRDRIDNFNQKLSKLTEHNDIPRVSAAGNG